MAKQPAAAAAAKPKPKATAAKRTRLPSAEKALKRPKAEEPGPVRATAVATQAKSPPKPKPAVRTTVKKDTSLQSNAFASALTSSVSRAKRKPAAVRRTSASGPPPAKVPPKVERMSAAQALEAILPTQIKVRVPFQPDLVAPVHPRAPSGVQLCQPSWRLPMLPAPWMQRTAAHTDHQANAAKVQMIDTEPNRLEQRRASKSAATAATATAQQESKPTVPVAAAAPPPKRRRVTFAAGTDLEKIKCVSRSRLSRLHGAAVARDCFRSTSTPLWHYCSSVGRPGSLALLPCSLPLPPHSPPPPPCRRVYEVTEEELAYKRRTDPGPAMTFHQLEMLEHEKEKAANDQWHQDRIVASQVEWRTPQHLEVEAPNGVVPGQSSAEKAVQEARCDSLLSRSFALPTWLLRLLVLALPTWLLRLPVIALLRLPVLVPGVKVSTRWRVALR